MQRELALTNYGLNDLELSAFLAEIGEDPDSDPINEIAINLLDEQFTRAKQVVSSKQSNNLVLSGNAEVIAENTQTTASIGVGIWETKLELHALKQQINAQIFHTVGNQVFNAELSKLEQKELERLLQQFEGELNNLTQVKDFLATKGYQTPQDLISQMQQTQITGMDRIQMLVSKVQKDYSMN